MAEVEIKNENLVYAKPKLITDNVMHYCPGCITALSISWWPNPRWNWGCWTTPSASAR